MVNIHNHDFKARNGRMFNDVISGPVLFRPGEVKRLEVSTAVVAELRAYKLARRRGAFELTREFTHDHCCGRSGSDGRDR